MKFGCLSKKIPEHSFDCCLGLFLKQNGEYCALPKILFYIGDFLHFKPKKIILTHTKNYCEKIGPNNSLEFETYK